MTHVRSAALALAALSSLGATMPAQAVGFSAFTFDTQASTSGLFGGVNGAWGNGDVRLDGVSFGGKSYTQAQLQTVSSASIVLDDGIDVARGGGNFAAGRGINAVADSWVGEGAATVTPTSADLQSALANFNLTGLVVTRENPGTAILDVGFATPTNTFLFYERGFNSDLLVQALNANNQVIGSYTILRASYAPSGVLVSTDNAAFVIAGQELGAIGLRSDEAVSRLRLSSYRSDVLNYNGPDYKVLALAPVAAPVPEPQSYALMLAGLGAVGFIARRRRQPSDPAR